MLLDVGRERFDALNVSGDGPQFFVRVPLAIRKHAGESYAMLGDPKNLGLGVRRADYRKLRNRRIQRVSQIRLARSAMASRTFVEIDRSEERRVGKECGSRWSPDH